MKKSSLALAFLSFSFLESLVGIFFLLKIPSNTIRARVWGYSYLRLAAGMAMFIVLGIEIALILMAIFRKDRVAIRISTFEGWIYPKNHLFLLKAGTLFVFIFSAGAFLFTWLFIFPYLRGILIWIGLSSLTFFLLLQFQYPQVRMENGLPQKKWRFPRLKTLERRQRQTFFILCLIGGAYFISFIPVNLKGAEDAHAFYMTGGDEYVIYPILTNMLKWGNSINQTLYRIFIYEDYHYGYPFYVASALVLLPVRVLFGSSFDQHFQLNLLLLRQLISVLPIILAALVFTWLGTHFRSWWKSLVMFLLILTATGVIKLNTRFWHPDGLTILMIALTFYFLERDHFKFGWDFYLAALTCGLASAIRLDGLFFVLAVLSILLYGFWQKSLAFRKMVWSAIGFITVMSAVMIFSNPFLFQSNARQRFVQIIDQKAYELHNGYANSEGQVITSNTFRSRIEAWVTYIEWDYDQAWYLLYLLAGTGILAIWGRDKSFPLSLLGWILIYGGFLIFMVVVQVNQYMLPLFLPIFASAFFLPRLFEEKSFTFILKDPRAIQILLNGMALGFCLIQIGINVSRLL